MKFIDLVLPAYWGSALINDDESGLGDDDIQDLNIIVDEMVKEYGQCHCIGISEDAWFAHYHDASHLDVRGCDVATFTFNVGA